MKTKTRNLLIIMPLLPLLLANSPAPRQEEYKDIEVTYLSEESLHNYNFYHFNVKNTGNGYLSSVYLNNQPGDTGFGAYIENNELFPPFESVLIEPGFDKEVVIASKNKLPESKVVVPECYSYYIEAEGVTFNEGRTVTLNTDITSMDNNNIYYSYPHHKMC